MERRKRRYVMSGGLAFTEQGDMKKLSRLSAQGWLLESFAFLGYYVRKSEPCHLIYSVDYHDVESGDMTSYEEVFEAGGWKRVCSCENIHIFSAEPGTKPIYTDLDSTRQKYDRFTAKIRPLLWAPVLTILTFALNVLLLLTDLDRSVKVVRITIAIGLIGLIVSVPVMMTYAASLVRRKRIR